MSYKVYRIENPRTQNGLWYDADRNLTAVVNELSDGKCAHLQMPFDEAMYAMGGLAWYSATDVAEEIPNWVSYQDMVELKDRGYNLYEFTVTQYRKVPGHVVFAMEHVVGVRVVGCDSLWPEEALA